MDAGMLVLSVVTLIFGAVARVLVGRSSGYWATTVFKIVALKIALRRTQPSERVRILRELAKVLNEQGPRDRSNHEARRG